MFYSAKQFAAACTTQGNPLYGISIFRHLRESRAPKQVYADILREVKKAIIQREETVQIPEKWQSPIGTYPHHSDLYIGKFFRPWDVCDHLRNWRPPAGDFGIGVEVEIGFNTHEACRQVVQAVSKWRHITIDLEGPAHPAEVTFPPVLYSKYGSRSQPSRYLKLLSSIESDVYPHHENQWVGTHVNVSSGDTRSFDSDRVMTLSRTLAHLRESDNVKYFGREHPYGYSYNRRQHIEYKMFNSVLDWRRLRQYVDEAVSLTKLLISETPITQTSVLDALEAGYNKNPL